MFRSIAGHWDLHRAGTPLYLAEVISSPTKETAKMEGKIAEWYPGTVCALNDTANYMGYKVSPFYRVFTYDKGRAVENYWNSNVPLSYFSERDTYRVHNPRWYHYTGNTAFFFGQHLNFFERPIDFEAYGDKEVYEFSVLIYQKGEGYAIEILDRNDSSKFSNSLISTLSWYVEKLQKEVFQPYYTIDKRMFPARFYKVQYDERGWYVEDYLDIKRKRSLGVKNRNFEWFRI